MLETKDFVHFKFIILNGPAVQNKGMALFPKKINGLYAMLSRQDDENILLMYSNNIHFWQTPKLLLRPAEPWEFVKIGTCGSPIETEREGYVPNVVYTCGSILNGTELIIPDAMSDYGTSFATVNLDILLDAMK